MSPTQLDGNFSARLAGLGQKVLAGGQVTRAEAEWLFSIDSQPDITDLLAWANRIRQQFKGNRIHLCSIINIKAGGCPENCRFCAQSAFSETGAPRHELVNLGEVLQASEEARANGVVGLGLVAAWKGIDEGPALDELCRQFAAMRDEGKVRPDASLGIIKNPAVARRLAESGVKCYNHNLETSRRFFPSICSSHSYEDRVETLRHLREAGIRICSGGIIGMGETREDRCDLAFALREAGADLVPINILNPIAGTPFEKLSPLPPMEVLQTIACFRFILPRQEILVAGGRVVNLRDVQPMIFLAGASALMVGNYLTTVNQPVEKDLQMIRDLGLDPRWEIPGEKEHGGPETILQTQQPKHNLSGKQSGQGPTK